MKTSLLVTVKSRARRQGVKEVAPGEYKVQVLSPPQKGEANRELLRLLAAHLKVPASRLKIVSGRTSHRKLVSIE